MHFPHYWSQIHKPLCVNVAITWAVNFIRLSPEIKTFVKHLWKISNSKSQAQHQKMQPDKQLFLPHPSVFFFLGGGGGGDRYIFILADVLSLTG